MYKLPKRGLLARSLRKVCIKDLIEIYAQDLLDYENGHRTTARLGQLESQLIPPGISIEGWELLVGTGLVHAFRIF